MISFTILLQVFYVIRIFTINLFCNFAVLADKIILNPPINDTTFNVFHTNQLKYYIYIKILSYN